ncbi:GNAT family N-acetyltransferase [Amycolatopsis sp. DR6-1]|uniref:GNAT family N-acetyltransferase n=1 Tax=Amycolatopsis dendrobii TaxID=2760662 RepID=A0A7W3W361_9PSEU|nr:GNAT family N-acetyltransferase [Amycolatopsis dendrobii]MBB1157900.1 GNAT family N-acetyltransferase [Amycolatopsis dendrobii]
MRDVDWKISEIGPGQAEASAILREYMDEVASRYYGRPATRAEVDAALADEPSADLVAPTGAFLLAYRDGKPAGCVGVRMVEPGLSALTKVYIRPEHRGHGGGKLIVAAAEEAAKRLGSARMRLDTRDDLVEARALYAAMGYAEVEAFNDDQYAEHWFSKDLN